MPASSRGRPHSPSEGGGECCTGSAPAVPCHSASPAQSISWTRNQGVRRPTSPGAFQTQLSTIRSSTEYRSRASSTNSAAPYGGIRRSHQRSLPGRISGPSLTKSSADSSSPFPGRTSRLRPHQERRPRALGDPPDQGRHGEQPLLPRSPPGRPDQAPPDRPQDRRDHCQEGLRRHQPDRRAGHPSPAGPARQ
jgi:hypothetical protein